MSEPDHECPHCGAVVRAGRTSCRECGSDSRTGWQSSEDIEYHATDLGADTALPPASPAPVSRRLIAVAVITAILGILALIFGKRR